MPLFTDKVVAVTGAAGNLGSATVKAFVAEGAKTARIDYSDEHLKSRFSGDPNIDSPDHLFLGGVDLRDTEATETLFQHILDKFGRIDALVNTVGTFRVSKVAEESVGEFENLFSVNVHTMLNTTRAVVPAMLKQQYGRVISVAAMTALHGKEGVGAYSASKAAVMRLTESLAAEEDIKRNNITVNAVMPGTIDTPENREWASDEEIRKWVAPAAVADVIVFLASDKARAITGASIPITGKE